MDGLGMRKGDYNRTSRWTEIATSGPVMVQHRIKRAQHSPLRTAWAMLEPC
jgi:hypothetical protein